MSVYAKAAIVVGILFGIHFGIAQFVDANFYMTNFLVSYVSQAVLTALILLALLQIDKKAKEQLGYAFLGLTSAKVILSYVIATQFLFQGTVIAKELKINFFIAFLIFLCLTSYELCQPYRVE